MAELLMKLRSLKCKELIIRLIFFLFVISGCLYQIIQVIEVYLKFETKVDVSYHYKSEFAVPIMSFCWKAKYVLKNRSIKSIEEMSFEQIYNQTKNSGDVIIRMEYRVKDAWVGIYNFSKYEINTLTGRRNKTKYDIGLEKKIIRRQGDDDEFCYNLIHPEINLNRRPNGFLCYIDLKRAFNMRFLSRNNAQDDSVEANMITLDSMFNIFNCFKFNQFIYQMDGITELHFQGL